MTRTEEREEGRTSAGPSSPTVTLGARDEVRAPLSSSFHWRVRGRPCQISAFATRLQSDPTSITIRTRSCEAFHGRARSLSPGTTVRGVGDRPVHLARDPLAARSSCRLPLLYPTAIQAFSRIRRRCGRCWTSGASFVGPAAVRLLVSWALASSASGKHTRWLSLLHLRQMYNGPLNPNPADGESGIVIYGYVPSLALGAVGVATFALAIVVHGWHLVRIRRTRTFEGLLVFGSVSSDPAGSPVRSEISHVN